MTAALANHEVDGGQAAEKARQWVWEVCRAFCASHAATWPLRLDAAKAAAPYEKPKLSSVEHKKPPIDLSKLTDADLEQLLEIYRRAGAVFNGSDEDETATTPPNAGPKSSGTQH